MNLIVSCFPSSNDFISKNAGTRISIAAQLFAILVKLSYFRLHSLGILSPYACLNPPFSDIWPTLRCGQSRSVGFQNTFSILYLRNLVFSNSDDLRPVRDTAYWRLLMDWYWSAVGRISFTLFCCFQMISYGFVLHEGSFCRSAFNLLDLIVVCVALISFVLQ